MVVNGPGQGAVQPVPYQAKLRSQVSSLPGQLVKLRHSVLYGIDIEKQHIGAAPDVLERLVGVLFQDVQLVFESTVGGVDLVGDDVEFFQRRSRSEARRRSNQRRARLGHSEGSRQFGYAPFVDSGLGVANPIEGKPAHQAGQYCQHHRSADAGVQQRGDAETRFRQRPEPSDHGTASFSDIMGW